LAAPVLVCEDDFDEEEVGEGVADGLVDEVDASAQDVEGFLLAGVAGLVLLDGVEGVVREDHGAVAVGFEIDTNVELFGCVVQVLHAGGCAVDLELEVIFNVLRGGAVGVGGLHNSNLELICQSTLANGVAEEGCYEGRDAVTVE